PRSTLGDILAVSPFAWPSDAVVASPRASWLMSRALSRIGQARGHDTPRSAGRQARGASGRALARGDARGSGASAAGRKSRAEGRATHRGGRPLRMEPGRPRLGRCVWRARGGSGGRYRHPRLRAGRHARVVRAVARAVVPVARSPRVPVIRVVAVIRVIAVIGEAGSEPECEPAVEVAPVEVASVEMAALEVMPFEPMMARGSSPVTASPAVTARATRLARCSGS